MQTLKVIVLLAACAAASPHPAAGGTDAASATSKWAPAKLFEPGTPLPTAGDLLPCINSAISKLGIDKVAQTEPALLKDILTNDMYLYDLPRVQKVFADDLATPKPLAPFVDLVRKGLTEHHKAIGSVVCAAQEDPKVKVAFDSVNPDIIKRTVHHTYLLDRLIKELGDDLPFMEEMQAYLTKTTSRMAGTESVIGRAWAMFKAAGWFGMAKDLTLNIGINSIIELRKAGTTVSEADQKKRARNLSINILEATLTDLFRGYIANAKVGKSIAFQYSQWVKLEGDKKLIRYGLSDNWVRHFETWNLAFVTGNLDYLNYLYPMLLTPRVILADGQSFMYERAIALWISLNCYLMGDMNKKPHLKFAGKEDLAKLGAINERYVAYLAAQEKK